MAKFEVFKINGEWRWRLVIHDVIVLESTKGYGNATQAEHEAQIWKLGVSAARIERI